ncbi:isochorismatase family protein [Actinacidiphila acididurans]|uniref:Isochorismatase family protein n=1 Tax=Actinacidiphila acididurans TaxID=2784346 RepID=A0ABS2TTX1_9ACTN|nr:isochorismatase family protein [Actinacidiphila acididurans]MBM9506792.1 isochorismatase family protein [Actinacidiphila acididurans]
MTVSTIDPTCALVVIDLQKGLAGLAPASVIEGASRLAGAFRQRGLPVVLVNVTGGPAGRTEFPPAGAGRPLPPDFAELIDELDAAPTDIRVTKRRVSAFHDTGLDTHLRDLGVTQLVLAGVATGSGVESTARSGRDHGYHVVVAADAVSDPDEAVHRHSVERIFPKIAETATVDEIVSLLHER